MNKKWTEDEKNTIRMKASIVKDKDLAAELSKSSGRKVTIASVRKQRTLMNIKKKSGRGVCSVIIPSGV
jgi:hypothetical protein